MSLSEKQAGDHDKNTFFELCRDQTYTKIFLKSVHFDLIVMNILNMFSSYGKVK